MAGYKNRSRVPAGIHLSLYSPVPGGGSHHRIARQYVAMRHSNDIHREVSSGAGMAIKAVCVRYVSQLLKVRRIFRFRLPLHLAICSLYIPHSSLPQTLDGLMNDIDVHRIASGDPRYLLYLSIFLRYCSFILRRLIVDRREVPSGILNLKFSPGILHREA